MRKYLLYAIGEIALVVIGILLAIQINTWYQSKINRSEEKEMIRRIYADLKSDTKYLLNIDSIYIKAIPNLERIFYLIDEQNDIDDVNEILDKYSAQLFELQPSKITFEEMKNTGRIYSLSDLYLKDALINYYTKFEEHQIETRKDRSDVSAFYFAHDNYAFWTLLQKKRKKQAISPELIEWMNNPNSIEWKNYEISIGYFQSTLKKHRHLIEELINLNQSLRSLIENEM
ncbi:MAG: hypothetical protein HKN68_10165 [Saprospiraceae bacterium]|nr:hypothetical protein [Saprospiraceae bacterium]